MRASLPPLVVVAVLACASGAARAEQPRETTVSAAYRSAVDDFLQGSWTARVGTVPISATFERGRLIVGTATSSYMLEGKNLVVATAGRKKAYILDITKDAFTLSGGDIEQTLSFTRRPQLGGTISSMLDIRAGRVLRILYRFFVLFLIVVLARVLLTLLDRLSRFVVFSERGPLRYLYPRQKNRARTLHSVGLNVVEYIIYFGAIGLMLNELGIDYTTYIASLSVVGLAIGFGSQGLVQDMVTGFFIVLEEQFEVGDLVDISGQTGRVVELGLRMTRIRNYHGQLVAIPNRNIGVVGNYGADAQRARVDLPVASADEAAALSESLGKLTFAVKEQFSGVIRDNPQVHAPFVLDTGENFARLEVTVWPGQTWVVTDEIVPRAREIARRLGIELVGDRVSVSYHSSRRASPS